jgi:hypothetical protein
MGPAELGRTEHVAIPCPARRCACRPAAGPPGVWRGRDGLAAATPQPALDGAPGDTLGSARQTGSPAWPRRTKRAAPAHRGARHQGHAPPHRVHPRQPGRGRVGRLSSVASGTVASRMHEC